MIPDYSTTEIVAVSGAAITAATFITILLQGVKDFIPGLKGRWALGTVYAVALVPSLLLWFGGNPEYNNPLTYAGLIVIWGALVVTARGIYHTMFQGPSRQEDQQQQQD